MTSTTDFKFKWNINNIIDRTKFSKEEKKPIELLNNDLTAIRHERLQGDDHPPVRIYSDTHLTLDQQTSLQWTVQIDSTHSFIEIGIMDPVSNQYYFFKGFKNEATCQIGDQYNSFEFGETFSTGDKVKINLELNQSSSSSSSASLHLYKNDKLLGTPFKDIQFNNNNKYYPFVGLNDEGDQITILV